MNEQELVQQINSGAPAACELEDCLDLATCVRVLMEFAWRAVNPPTATAPEDNPAANGGLAAHPITMSHVDFGLTKREWFAGMAMQGLSAVPGHINTTASTLAMWAVEQADALLAALAK